MMDLDEAAVGGLLRMEDLIPVMEHALADFSNGKVVQPVRTIVPVVGHPYPPRDDPALQTRDR
jgi:alanine dehydrogenase